MDLDKALNNKIKGLPCKTVCTIKQQNKRIDSLKQTDAKKTFKADVNAGEATVLMMLKFSPTHSMKTTAET